MKFSQYLIEQDIKSIEQKWKDQGIDLSISDNLTNIVLHKIVVPKENRNSGIGTKVMKDLIEYANKKNKIIALTPSKDFGGKITKLRKFYKGLGFVENKGKKINLKISEDYYKEPNK